VRFILSERGITWERIENVYAFPYGGIYHQGYIYYYDNFAQRHSRLQNSYEVIVHDLIFNFLHRWVAYGHIIIDYLPVFTTISAEYRAQGHFIVSDRKPFLMHAMLQVFGIPENHILSHNRHILYFGCEMLMVQPLQVGMQSPTLMAKMRSVFVRRLELDQHPPFRFVLYNRRGGRRITHFEVISTNLTWEFPRINWEIYQDEKAHFFREHLLFFTPRKCQGITSVLIK
jgi:hypothetical protein